MAHDKVECLVGQLKVKQLWDDGPDKVDCSVSRLKVNQLWADGQAEEPLWQLQWYGLCITFMYRIKLQLVSQWKEIKHFFFFLPDKVKNFTYEQRKLYLIYCQLENARFLLLVSPKETQQRQVTKANQYLRIKEPSIIIAIKCITNEKKENICYIN